MHSDPAAVKKSVRGYMTIGALLLVFTAITVAANQVHLALPLAVAVALISQWNPPFQGREEAVALVYGRIRGGCC